MTRQAILFDIDGTLVDSNEAHVDAWYRAFAQQGHPFERSQIHDQVGKGGDNLIPALLPDATEEERRQLEQIHGEIYKREYLNNGQSFPGARDLLTRCKADGHRVVLASSAGGEEVEHYVQLFDAAGLLDGTTSKDDVAHSKPCPDIFQAALDKLGAAPGEALVVGDTPYDVTAACRAGMKAIGLRSGRFTDAQLSGALAIFDDVQALLADYDLSPLSTDWKAATAAAGSSELQTA